MYDSLSDIISDIEVLHSTLSTGRDFDVSDAKKGNSNASNSATIAKS